MLITSFSTEDIPALKLALEEFSKLPKTKLRKVVNQWRFTLANNINLSLSGTVLKKRTKRLFNSVNPHQNLTVVEMSDNTFVVKLKKNIAKYALAHETGETIRPKNKEWLTIPLREGRGDKRPIPLTRYKNKFFRPSKKDSRDLVAYWKKNKKEVIPIFVLKKEIKLEPRPWFQLAVERSIPNFIKQVENA